jgi:hypothetical protein
MERCLRKVRAIRTLNPVILTSKVNVRRERLVINTHIAQSIKRNKTTSFFINKR